MKFESVKKNLKPREDENVPWKYLAGDNEVFKNICANKEMCCNTCVINKILRVFKNFFAIPWMLQFKD